MAKDQGELKHFTMRMPKELWLFLKSHGAKKEMSMTDIIVMCVEKYKNRVERVVKEEE